MVHSVLYFKQNLLHQERTPPSKESCRTRGSKSARLDSYLFSLQVHLKLIMPHNRTVNFKSCALFDTQISFNSRPFTTLMVKGSVLAPCRLPITPTLTDSKQKDEVYLNLVQEFVPETVYRASRFFNKMKTTMPILEVKLYTYQLFRALAYIHSQGICHRDIKPQNLLLDPNSGILKLCDFGSAKILVENEPNVSYICSRYYRAPELIFGATNYTTKIGKTFLDFCSSCCTTAPTM